MDCLLRKSSILICLLVFVCTAKAQNAESASRAEAIVADSGLWVSTINPAAANYSQKKAFGVGYQNYYFIPQLHSTSVVANLRLWRGCLISAISLQTGYAVLTQQEYLLGYGLRLHHTLSLGVAFALQRTSLIGIPSTLALYPHVGLRYCPIAKLSLAFSIQNLSNQSPQQSPFVLRCAIQSLHIENTTLSLQCDKEYTRPLVLHLGCAYSFCSQVSLRAGVSSGTHPLSYGIHFQFNNWRSCIAAQQHPQLGVRPSVCMTYCF